jgi:Flp pilus assembly protein TadB
MERQRDGETERQKDRKADRQIYRKKERQKDRKAERQKDRKTVSKKDRRTLIQKDIKTERQTNTIWHYNSQSLLRSIWLMLLLIMPLLLSVLALPKVITYVKQ